MQVDGDGRLVPATDDEIMEVENFLAVDDVEMHLVSDTVQSICDERSSSGMSQLASSEGLSHCFIRILDSNFYRRETII